MVQFAMQAINVSDPHNPIFPKDIMKINISECIVGILYNTREFSPVDLSLDCLLYGSSHTTSISDKVGKLNSFVTALHSHMAKG